MHPGDGNLRSSSNTLQSRSRKTVSDSASPRVLTGSNSISPASGVRAFLASDAAEFGVWSEGSIHPFYQPYRANSAHIAGMLRSKFGLGVMPSSLRSNRFSASLAPPAQASFAFVRSIASVERHFTKSAFLPTGP